ncbi:uncharacterized protein EKO05_0005366 [Ascochyta rabiei]|uniref:uncharacterized protein n=1 Tax=Didymella rabiei TaxID=5454 RepID=UPI002201F226|nr:uncharacterized protein EKO05_0005366 [Ascochyta rabiei]UPX14895.1 hypothetical protein EKO05_0005366 [Ascochyta rabiei]
MGARFWPTQTLISCLIDVEFCTIQDLASQIINRQQDSPILKRSFNDATLHSDVLYSRKRPALQVSDAAPGPNFPSYTASDRYPGSGSGTFTKRLYAHTTKLGSSSDSNSLLSQPNVKISSHNGLLAQPATHTMPTQPQLLEPFVASAECKTALQTAAGIRSR